MFVFKIAMHMCFGVEREGFKYFKYLMQFCIDKDLFFCSFSYESIIGKTCW